MRTRTALLITAAAALIVGALETPSQAATATWKKMQYWTIVGDPSTPYCGGWSSFKDGTTIHISINPSGWNIAVQGVQSVPGDTYTVAMATNKTAGVLYGKGIRGGAVLFDSMSPSSIAEIALAPQLYIQGLGTFNLKGSYKAVTEIMSCYAAITGRGA